MSQLYVLESNMRNGLKNPIVFKSTGIPQTSPPETAPPLLDNNVSSDGSDTETEDFEDPNLEVVSAENRIAQARPKNRLSELLCYICKLRLGPDNSLRIGRSFKVAL